MKDIYIREKIKLETICNALKISKVNGPFVRRPINITVYKLLIKISFISCTTFVCNKYLDTKEISSYTLIMLQMRTELLKMKNYSGRES